MRPVNGSGRKGEQQSDDADKDLKKRAGNAGEKVKKHSKVRRDSSSSEETQSDGGPGESSKLSLKQKTKQLPKAKPVSVAPHSTTYGTDTNAFSSSTPTIHPSRKRDEYQSAAIREKVIGEKGRYRQPEPNLQGSHPELKRLWLKQFEKELSEKVMAELEKVELRNRELEDKNKKDIEEIENSKYKKELVERSQVAGGYLEAEVKDKNDIDVLATVLEENPSIHTLKLISNFCGSYVEDVWQPRDLYSAIFGIKNPYEPEDKSFRKLLGSCKNIHNLNLSGCSLLEKNWIDLVDCLSNIPKLQCLSLGGGNYITERAAQALARIFESKTPALRELFVDGFKFLDLFPYSIFLNGIADHKTFKKITLKNMNGVVSHSTVGAVWKICSTNPDLQYLSLNGSTLSNSNHMFGLNPQNPLEGHSIPIEESIFRMHRSIRVLDLTGCDLSRGAMTQLIRIISGSRALVEVHTGDQEMTEDDRSKLTAMTMRNRRDLELRAAAAFSLLIGNAASQVDTWPQELTGVFVENAPLEALLDIVAVIDDGIDSVPAVAESSGEDNSDSSSEWRE